MPDTACRVPTKNPICRDGILAVRNLYLIPNLIINRQHAVRFCLLIQTPNVKLKSPLKNWSLEVGAHGCAPHSCQLKKIAGDKTPKGYPLNPFNPYFEAPSVRLSGG